MIRATALFLPCFCSSQPSPSSSCTQNSRSTSMAVALAFLRVPSACRSSAAFPSSTPVSTATSPASLAPPPRYQTLRRSLFPGRRPGGAQGQPPRLRQSLGPGRSARLPRLAQSITHSPYGPVWRTLRKVCVRDLLSQGNLDVVRPLRRREVRRVVATIRKRVGMPVQVKEVILLAILSLMTSMLWGATAAAEDTGADECDAVTKELVEIVESIMTVLGAPNISDLLPALAPLDLQGLGRKMTRLMAQFEMLIDELLQQMTTPAGTATENRGSSEGAAASTRKRNFLQVLLEIVERGDLQTPLNMDNARGLLLDMLVGSTHTTSTAVEWAMAELLLHPEAMARVHEELDAAVGRHKAVEESDVCKLPYVDAVLKETLRLHPIVPLLIPQEPSSSCVIGGYTVPKGTSVFINVWAIHRDPSLWEDPDEFMPERFLNGTLDGNDSAGASKVRHELSGQVNL